MDAVKFIEERKRLCGTYEICKDCPANGNPGCMFNLNYGADADEQVSFLEEWAAAHPRKTRQSVFLKQWPEAKISDDGSINIMPYMLCFDEYNVDICTKEGRKCGECHRKFWSQEVE